MTPDQQLMYLQGSVNQDKRTGKPTMTFSTVTEAQEWIGKHKGRSNA